MSAAVFKLLRRNVPHSFLRRSFRSSGVIESKLHLSSRSICTEDHTSFLTKSCSPNVALPRNNTLPLLRKFSTTGPSTLNAKKECLTKIKEGGQELSLSWKDDGSVSLYAVWLHHNCQCPECMASNGQSIVAPELLDPSITLHSADVSGRLWYRILCPDINYCDVSLALDVAQLLQC